jgi:apolipoprotein D and lipocalin family protein
MGDWFVIAAIPTFIEKNAYNAIESYRLAADGTVETTFTFRDGSFDGPLKRYTPRGFVNDSSGAVWGMQFIWPIRAEYRVAYLDPQYRHTIIARTARDYVWVMARTPSVSDEVYRTLVEKVGAIGYDPILLRRVPQRWPQ